MQPLPRALLSALATLCLSSSATAASSDAFLTQHFTIQNWKPVATFTGGAAFTTDAGASNFIPANTAIFSFYDYRPIQSTQTQSYWGGFLGAEGLITPSWLIQAGISYYQPTSFHVHGYVTQGADTASQNQYAYGYSIQSHQLLAEAKLLYNDKPQFHPYLSGGLGASWNHSNDFSVDIVPVFTAFSNQFKNNTTAAFSYSVGVGFDIDIKKNMRLGLGYRFMDLGQASTGTSFIDDVATSNRLSQSHLYVNALVAQFTFDLLP